ncbi:MAG TPA: LamG-like jellyroll fold domain-containing protein [Thermoanaerobaculia bacterium]|nr:LamG-like jellyroll fold domain-containing protein [Thermoanaerobaculia bacterium]
MVSSPGVTDYVKLISGPSTFSPIKGSPIPTNCPLAFCPISYSAQFYDIDGSGSKVSSWAWKIELFHAQGAYALPLPSPSSTPISSNLDINSPFTLPTGYDWHRDALGNIGAKVSIDVIDTDGFGHHAEQTVGVNYPPSETIGTLLCRTGAPLAHAPMTIAFFDSTGKLASQTTTTDAAGHFDVTLVCAASSHQGETFMISTPSCADGWTIAANRCSGDLGQIVCQQCGSCAPPLGSDLWLPFDELAGPTSLNAAGGNQGVFHNNPSPAPGYVGNSLCFDGAQSYVEVQSYPAIDVTTGNFSVDAWIRRSVGDDGIRVIVDKRREEFLDTSVFGYSFFLLDGELWFQLADGPYSNYRSGAAVPLDGLWHQVAVTVVRNDPAGGLFYLDGKPAGVPFNPLRHPGSLASRSSLRVGSRSSSVSAVFKGCIDEVETFGRALGADEIAGLFAAGQNGTCKQSCSLPWASPFCSGDSSLLATAEVCSSLATPQTFAYTFRPLLAAPGCPAAGPTSFSPAGAGAVVVQPGRCALVPVTIGRPSGLAAGQLACYSLSVETAGGARTANCAGSVQVPGDLCGRWRNPFPYDFLGDVATSFQIAYKGPGTKSFDFEISAVTDTLAPTAAISLNGLPPGTPLHETVDLPAGGEATLAVVARFQEPQPGRFFTLLAQTDLLGDGILVPLGSALLQNVIPATCKPPQIVQPPESRIVTPGQQLALSVTAADASLASYQWRHNGVVVTDARTTATPTSSALAIDAADFTDAGLYDVVVTTACGVATSPPAVVSVAGPACTPGPTTLCLAGGRFAVGVDWQTPQGIHGSGQAVQLTGEAGYFSFFDPANAELAVKVLDACPFTGGFWVFAAGVTDLAVDLTVTDTQTGAGKRYHNPAGRAFVPIQDSAAFTGCPALSPALASAAGRSSGPLPPPPATPADREAAAGSASPPPALVLADRFRVEARWQTTPETTGDGQPLALSRDSGTFWFFDRSNLELLVKVLDACSLNGRYWVFAGGLTDVQIDLKVTDTLTGAVRNYASPGGAAFSPILDTNAFATCP